MEMSPRKSKAFSKAVRISSSLARDGIHPSRFSWAKPGETSISSGLVGMDLVSCGICRKARIHHGDTEVTESISTWNVLRVNIPIEGKQKDFRTDSNSLFPGISPCSPCLG